MGSGLVVMMLIRTTGLKNYLNLNLKLLYADDNLLRLAGGYENVPTVDIHMNQIGIHDEWLYIVKTYAAPMVNRFYVGYNPESKPNLMFVVRYKPGEQDRLRPHHDSSTWTFQIALNKPNVRKKVIFFNQE